MGGMPTEDGGSSLSLWETAEWIKHAPRILEEYIRLVVPSALPNLGVLAEITLQDAISYLEVLWQRYGYAVSPANDELVLMTTRITIKKYWPNCALQPWHTSDSVVIASDSTLTFVKSDGSKKMFDPKEHWRAQHNFHPRWRVQGGATLSELTTLAQTVVDPADKGRPGHFDSNLLVFWNLNDLVVHHKSGPWTAMPRLPDGFLLKVKEFCKTARRFQRCMVIVGGGSTIWNMEPVWDQHVRQIIGVLSAEGVFAINGVPFYEGLVQHRSPDLNHFYDKPEVLDAFYQYIQQCLKAMVVLTVQRDELQYLPAYKRVEKAYIPRHKRHNLCTRVSFGTDDKFSHNLFGGDSGPSMMAPTNRRENEQTLNAVASDVAAFMGEKSAASSAAAAPSSAAAAADTGGGGNAASAGKTAEQIKNEEKERKEKRQAELYRHHTTEGLSYTPPIFEQALPTGVPAFNPCCRGSNLIWSMKGYCATFDPVKTKEAYSFHRSLKNIEIPAGNPDPKVITEFLRRRNNRDGYPMSNLLHGDWMPQDNGCYRMTLKHDVAALPTADEQPRVFIHGTQMQSLYSILYHGGPKESNDLEAGETFSQYAEGVYAFSTIHFQRCRFYSSFVELCNDGWFVSLFIELTAAKGYHYKSSNHKSNQQHYLKKGGFVMSAVGCALLQHQRDPPRGSCLSGIGTRCMRPTPSGDPGPSRMARRVRRSSTCASPRRSPSTGSRLPPSTLRGRCGVRSWTRAPFPSPLPTPSQRITSSEGAATLLRSLRKTTASSILEEDEDIDFADANSGDQEMGDPTDPNLLPVAATAATGVQVAVPPIIFRSERTVIPPKPAVDKSDGDLSTGPGIRMLRAIQMLDPRGSTWRPHKHMAAPNACQALRAGWVNQCSGSPPRDVTGTPTGAGY